MQHLYISYPDERLRFAHRLVEDLQAAGYPVFVDAVSSVGTMSWAAETRHAIRTCGAVLMVLSPAEGRRVGIRHEGVLAKRRHKPVYVLRRSPGDLPRYLTEATVIDCADQQYRLRAAGTARRSASGSRTLDGRMSPAAAPSAPPTASPRSGPPPPPAGDGCSLLLIGVLALCRGTGDRVWG